MENLLIMGINTRPLVNSALKLDYNSFSVSYFKTVDFINPFDEKHILNQESIDFNDSFNCGSLEDNYSPEKLLDVAEDYLDLADKIVFSSGISADDFLGKFYKFKNKICGNLKTDNVNDKFKFYNKLKNKFNLPLSFKPVDIYEIIDIANQYLNKQFILKPVKGSGGYGTFLLNNETLNKFKTNEFFYNFFNDNYLMQEYISGVNLSSSVLSTKFESKNIINTRLLVNQDLGVNNPIHINNINTKDNFNIPNNSNNQYNSNFNEFIYSGNILPLTSESFCMFNSFIDTNQINNQFSTKFDEVNKILEDLSQDLISYFKLIGSNGVDFILSKDAVKSNSLDINDFYPIEINPRFQGTYESCENVLGINLLDAHIKACDGELINIPKIDYNSKFLFSVKKIEYALSDVIIGDLKFKNIFDIPYKNVKIEKNQPIATIISSDSDLNLAILNMKIASKKIRNNIKVV